MCHSKFKKKNHYLCYFTVLSICYCIGSTTVFLELDVLFYYRMTRKYHYSLDQLHNITKILNLVKLLTAVVDAQFSSLNSMSQHGLTVTYCRRHESRLGNSQLWKS
jgi:hypothetical protein